MNHSCDPNTGYIHLSEDEDRVHYRIPCLRDIKPGDLLTADYSILWYDLGPAGFDKCACGARNCLGIMRGFKVTVD
jgi:SET domain-containing protein